MLDISNLPRMIDLSCVKTDITLSQIDEMVELAKKHRCICCFAMPCYTEELIKRLGKQDDIAVGGTIGFPSGADLISSKVETAKRLLELGCGEFDMVINVSALKSGDYELVERDIQAVHDVVAGNIFKVILEVTCLNEYEIQKGSELAVKHGADFVKTGTGWMSNPTTVEHIKLIKSTIGDSARIKAAGGVRTLNDIEQMTAAGCSRYGIGIASVKNIFKEANLLQ